MNCFMVLGATNSVIDYANIYSEENMAAKETLRFIGQDSATVASGSIISSDSGGISRRAVYLPLKVENEKINDYLYILVRSVPYLHSTTKARVFYNEQEAKAEVHSFNAAVSRANFHAYLFTFPVTF